MEDKVQQRVCIDFCFRLGKSGAETYEMLQAAFGESCLSWSKTIEWYSRFKSGRQSFEDDPHPDRLSTSHTKETVASVREIIRADWRLTIREVAEVSKEFHKTVLQRLRGAVCRHRPEKWHSSNWILHHDNAPAHRAVTTNEFLAKHNLSSLPHPPYSPDLAPCNFFLFPQLKKTMKGCRFDYVEKIQANAMRQLRAITKMTTRGAFIIGRNAGISAYKHKDTTSKETRPTSR